MKTDGSSVSKGGSGKLPPPRTHWTRRAFQVAARHTNQSDPSAGPPLDGQTKNHQPSRVETFSQHAPANAEQVGRALAHLREYVRERGLKNSQVREKVLEGALAFEGHFTVEDLARSLKKMGVSNVHAATIYRSLPLLIDAGLVEPALIADGEGQLYESAFERGHHDHLVCVKCRRVVEFYSETLEALQREIAERYGYTLEEHVHELRGLCENCRTTGDAQSS